RFDFDLMDLVGAGHLGLHAAIAKFEPDRFESRLSTYAAGWIRWYIQNYIRRNAGPVRLPESNAHRQLSQMSARLLADARKSCERECVDPTDSELCERIGRRIGMPAAEVGRSLKMLQGATLSLDHRAGDSGSQPAWAQSLADDSADPEDEVILRLDYAKARKRIMALADDILGERERIVFFARCMTDKEQVPHLDALATRFGVSRERIHQLENSAKRKIATALSKEGFARFVGEGQTLRLPSARDRVRHVPPIMPYRDSVALAAVAV
ncbi:MAG TPA: sigma-70 family RNA polymerase sigma factor, partial [Acetobacteraceae bacterium]